MEGEEIVLVMTAKELIDLRVDILERLILKRNTSNPEHVFALYQTLCKMEV